MGFWKEGRSSSSSSSSSPRRVVRGIKTLFFLLTMLSSLLLFSAPVLLLIAADAVLPSAILSASLSPPPTLSLHSLSSHLRNYDFRYSLVDIPLVSLLRSAVILCVYSLCDGPSLSRGPYLVTATVCSVTSLVFVSLKAYFAMGGGWSNIGGGGGGRRGYGGATEVGLFVCSLVLGAGHVVVAYRTRCRERRKLLVYKIDIEAVSACKNGFPRYYKVLQQERVK